MASPIVNKTAKSCAEALGISERRMKEIDDIFFLFCRKMDEDRFSHITEMLDALFSADVFDYSEMLYVFYLVGVEMQIRQPVRIVIDMVGRSGDKKAPGPNIHGKIERDEKHWN